MEVSARDQVFAGGYEPTEYHRGKRFPAPSRDLARQLHQKGEGNPVWLALSRQETRLRWCTPGGKGKLKGQCSSFKTQEGVLGCSMATQETEHCGSFAFKQRTEREIKHKQNVFKPRSKYAI